MEQYVIAHDLGTSGNKATLFSLDGGLVKSTLSPYGTRYFNSNWVEQDPEDWWKAICDSTRMLLREVDKNKVLAVSFSGQMMGCLCVDKKGVPLRPSMIWADMRAVAEQNELADKIDPWELYQITGHRLSSSYSIEKLMWVKKNEPDIYKETHKVLHAKDYIIFKMTGRFLTDYSDATGTNAFDLKEFRWSDKIFDASGVDMDKFPEPVASTTIAGEVSAEVADACGLAKGTKVVVGGGDGMCAALGTGGATDGKAHCCLGSSAWLAVTNKKPIYDTGQRIVNWAHIVPGLIVSLGPMQAAGASFNWMKNEICSLEQLQAQQQGKSPYDFINPEIESSKPGANNLLFLPYLVGERSPRWNPNAKGALIGLKMEHKREDILRSVVEGIGMNLRLILDVLRKEAEISSLNLIGGLAKGAVQRQIFADIFGIEVKKLSNLEEATSMGAAITAGVGIGELPGFEAIERFIEVESTQKPNPENVAMYEKMTHIFDKAYFALVDIYEDLTN